MNCLCQTCNAISHNNNNNKIFLPRCCRQIANDREVSTKNGIDVVHWYFLSSKKPRSITYLTWVWRGPVGIRGRGGWTRRCGCGTSWRRRIAVDPAGWESSVRVGRVRVGVPGVLGPRRRDWRRLGQAFRLLLNLSFDLGKNWGRVDSPSVIVALVGQQVFAVMFFQCVGTAGRSSDAKLSCDVLPSLVFRAL